MKTYTITARLAALALLLPLTACSQSGHDGNGNGNTAQAKQEAQQPASPSYIATQIQKGIEQGKQELLTENIDVTSVRIGNHPHDTDHHPKAVITPDGNLVIAGNTVDATPEQHALLVDYRQQVIGIASAGMDIGAKSADMGVGMAKEAIFGKLSGQSDQQIEESIKPQTDKIRAAAMQLCKLMPGVMASQQKLAAAMPAFQPYATMTQQDIDDCGRESDHNGKQGVAASSD